MSFLGSPLNACATVEERPFRACPELAEGAALEPWNLSGFSPVRAALYRCSFDGITIAFNTKLTRLKTIAPTNAAKNPRT